MKKINVLALTLCSIPFALYAAATLQTETGFFYPTDKKHSDSTYIGYGDKNPAFGNRCHLANDYNYPTGTPIYSVGPGVVESASTTTPGYGSAEGAAGGVIIVKHTKADDTFFFAIYGHIQNPTVAAGDTVTSGQQMAEVGTFTAGGVSLPHLHFGINPGAANLQGYTPTAACNDYLGYVDPEPYLLANSPKLSPAETCKAIDDSDDTTVNTILTTASVLDNDTDTDGDTLTVSSANATSANGVSVTNNGDGTFTYTPAIDFSGTDSFTYTVTDSNGCSDEGTVTITVTDDSTPTTPTNPTTPETESDSGGGSTSIWGLFFLSLSLVLRRFNRQKRDS